MIEQVVARWKSYLSSHDVAALADLLDDDVVFYSPIVFTPQVGKDVTMLYLLAAGQALPGTSATEKVAPSGAGNGGRFRITKEVLAGDTAVFEFETTVDGKYVNGVDIIRCNQESRIVEFRVMIRPLQAVSAVHAQMGRALDRLKASQDATDESTT